MKVLHKIKTKNITHAHITPKGQVIAFYKERHAKSGKEIEWQENVTEEGAIKVYNAQGGYCDLEFRSLYIDREVAKLLPYIQYFDVWPVSNEYAMRQAQQCNKFSDLDLSTRKQTITVRLSAETTIPLCESIAMLVQVQCSHKKQREAA